jgi:protein-S-isoprenylcysteine O-methyltransferase Ste14
MGPDQVVPLVAAGSCFVAYAIGTKLVFPGGDRATLGLRLIIMAAVVGGATELTAIARARPLSAWHSAAGTLGFVAALMLFLAAARETRPRPLTPAFSTDIPEHLVRSGPYRVVRHPFYAAYLLTYLCGWVVTGSPVLLAVLAVMASLYVIAARKEERKFRGSLLADQYTAYAARTGMFWPARVRAGRRRDRRSAEG